MMIANQTDFQNSSTTTQPTPTQGGVASSRPSPILPPTTNEPQLLGEILGSHLPLAIIASNFDTTVTAIAQWMATPEIQKRIALIERAALAATRVRSNRFLSTKNGCCGIHSVVLHVRGKFSFQ
jgi:hypothetical protein